ncbi:DNA excision repair protein ERCC-8-like [Ornithodoros turicata]|uniref:DNA excision repair protein ERCC-8-like n=1 Tax=Ornithodoros turicata TaxID=34597 RepID=UPI003139FB33
MLSAYTHVQCGLISHAAFTATETTKREYDLELSRCKDIEVVHSAGVNSLSLDPVDGRYLLSGAADGSLYIHDLFNTSGKVQHTCKAICKVERKSRYAHSFSVGTVQWYPFDTGLFTSSGMDGRLKVWDANALRPADVFQLGAKAYSHHMSPTATRQSIVAVGTTNPWVTLVDLQSGTICQQLRGHSGRVLAVRWSPCAPNLLASGSQDNQVMLWDVRCAKGALAKIDAHGGAVTSLAFEPGGFVLLSLGTDERMRAWDVAKAKALPLNFGLVPVAQRPLEVAVSNNLALVPSEGVVLVLDIRAGEPVGSLQGHFNEVNCVTFCPLTLTAYSGANDRSVLCWTSSPELERAYCAETEASKRLADAWSSDEGA